MDSLHSLKFESLEVLKHSYLKFLDSLDARRRPTLSEHLELRARLDPWKSAALYVPVILKNLYGCRVYMIIGGVGES